ncbi:hypothetical protein SADUNF_Sadunf04G0072300 [Salix dunnii]|uniref:Uncharacterized protein n=1 Tax=Salix dunnii TaxID=1413687 RepID=A0A835K6F2_9ROSI|nr:hypothetical protein SADUNF_Sadunf04G0072300 [Salix dunnii]
MILYTPNDAIQLTVAESSADFDHLSGSDIREAIKSNPSIPELPVTDAKATAMTLQLTLEPELTPVFGRTGIQDPAGFEKRLLNGWLELKVPGEDPNCSRSLKFLPVVTPRSSLVRAVVEVSREQINKLGERARTQFGKIHKEDPDETKLVHMSNCRARLDPPIHARYFGNCLYSFSVVTESEALLEENGFACAVERLSDAIRNLEKGVLDGTARPGAALLLGVAGSTHNDVYGTDLGRGRPKKVEITSIDQTGVISMSKCKDGSGVEFTSVLEKHEMDKFMSLCCRWCYLIKALLLGPVKTPHCHIRVVMTGHGYRCRIRVGNS